ncbi:MAG: T9SS type A sorting domain-containing protein [Candidatus Aegiribacteria sp.]|nr:T9SS type A sorting domain-containing protein [Candidatus Aegiribacteria sp.]
MRVWTVGKCSVALAILLLSALASADPPPGYYDPAAGLSGSALQEALHDIIDNHTNISYDAIWLAFFTTDDRYGDKVWDMYSDVPGGTPPYTYVLDDDQGGSANGEGEGYNREHSWPKSWFNDASPMNTDLFHIVPTDIYVNNRRGNYPYGEVTNPTWTSLNYSYLGPCSYPGYSGIVFEPIDGYKGDFARNYFYMATRYFGEGGSWPGSAMATGAVLTDWAEEMLIGWHSSDPVSTKEIDRNEAVYDIQHNRNPFIDHPEYVLMVYDPTSVEGGEFQTASAVLYQNVPNPFPGITTIRFTLPEATMVTITVYDISGKLVNTLAENSQLSPGYHDVIWSGRTASGEPAATGIYFCRLSTPEVTITLRMLMI